ncbi:MAG: hypothetical protein IJJ44_02250 [Solobacterium sp.]|nr:hypothetical protein [Solobacterium sp.]
MNTASWIILVILVIIVILDILYLKKTGISSCGGNCSACGSTCHWANDVKKAQKAIRRRNRIRKFLRI